MDKYGRILADVYPLNNLGKSASDFLLEQYPQYVYEYHGGHKSSFYI